jgi:peptidyl-prolyl cis-trans isomerase SurA
MAAAALSLGGAALAQESGEQGGGFVLPENPQIFGKNNPNLRTATVIINGEVITG